jgi:hypothetical protein
MEAEEIAAKLLSEQALNAREQAQISAEQEARRQDLLHAQELEARK